MIQREQIIPPQGLTLTEMASGAGASVSICPLTRDLELRVISGEAATMGEGLSNLVKERLEYLKRHPEEAPIEMVDCGTVVSNPDGTVSIVETKDPPAVERYQLRLSPWW